MVDLTYTIGDHRSFTEFIKDLRVILADHQDREDICDRHVDPNISSSRKHPLLPPRAEQPVRWIRIKLQVVEGEESSSSATLLMRDDNVDVIGFINQSGVCYDFADPKRSARRILPQEYKPVLLGWGNSYKSILGVRKEEEVMDMLTSARLGKNFATHAGTGGPKVHGLRVRKDESCARCHCTWLGHWDRIHQAIDDRLRVEICRDVKASEALEERTLCRTAPRLGATLYLPRAQRYSLFFEVCIQSFKV